MKSQNDWIVSIVAALLAIIIGITTWQTAPKPTTPPNPEVVPGGPPKFTAGEVKFGNALPGENTAGSDFSGSMSSDGGLPPVGMPTLGGPGGGPANL